MSRLLLLRHAESEWNAQGRWQGWADPPLSPDGERRSVEAGRLLRDFRFAAAVASDLRRAVRTAQLIAGAVGLPEQVSIDPGLREYDVGEWSGLTRLEIEDGWPGALQEWRSGRMRAAPGGETREGFTTRIVSALTGVGTTDRGGPVLVITHGGVIGSLERLLAVDHRPIGHLGGRWFDVSGAGLSAGDAVWAGDAGTGAETIRRDGPADGGGEGEGTEISGPDRPPAAANVSPALYLPNREG